MARPARPVNAQTGNLTKTEKRIRGQVEERLRGGDTKLNPPAYLSKTQKQIFKNVVAELEASRILGNLDVYVLSQFAVAQDRAQTYETILNDDPSRIESQQFMNAKSKNDQLLIRLFTELSLSPQARAKIGNAALNAAKEKDSELMKVLQE